MNIPLALSLQSHLPHVNPRIKQVLRDLDFSPTSEVTQSLGISSDVNPVTRYGKPTRICRDGASVVVHLPEFAEVERLPLGAHQERGWCHSPHSSLHAPLNNGASIADPTAHTPGCGLDHTPDPQAVSMQSTQVPSPGLSSKA